MFEASARFPSLLALGKSSELKLLEGSITGPKLAPVGTNDGLSKSMTAFEGLYSMIQCQTQLYLDPKRVECLIGDGTVSTMPAAIFNVPF